jgi:hypothetical protein
MFFILIVHKKDTKQTCVDMLVIILYSTQRQTGKLTTLPAWKSEQSENLCI